MVDDAKLAALLAAPDYASLTDQPAADHGNERVVAGDAYIALGDLINVLGTYLAIPALARDADSQSATKDFSATLLWQMERQVIQQFRTDNPAVQQGFAALTAEGVLTAPCVAALNAASKQEMRSRFEAAGVVGPGGAVTHLDVARARIAPQEAQP